MADYSALMDLEKKPESPIARKEESPKGRKPEIMPASNQESLPSGDQAFMKARKPDQKPNHRKVPKYSTQLPEELQIEITVYATRNHMADYEVVWRAITEYLERHK